MICCLQYCKAMSNMVSNFMFARVWLSHKNKTKAPYPYLYNSTTPLQILKQLQSSLYLIFITQLYFTNINSNIVDLNDGVSTIWNIMSRQKLGIIPLISC